MQTLSGRPSPSMLRDLSALRRLGPLARRAIPRVEELAEKAWLEKTWLEKAARETIAALEAVSPPD